MVVLKGGIDGMHPKDSHATFHTHTELPGSAVALAAGLGEKVGIQQGSAQIIHFNRVFHYKLSILGYPYFWKHPYDF